MDTMKPNKSKLSRTFHKVLNLKSPSKIASNSGNCLLSSHCKFKEDQKTNHSNRAVLHAVAAKLFASVSSIKAAYAELQLAQHPYNSDAIQAADQAVVDELKIISELKRSFLKKQINISTQVALMLAEIQEQQSLMRTYEITIKKMETEKETKCSELCSLKSILEDSMAMNRTLENKLNASGSLSVLDNLHLSKLNPSHFVQFLHSTVRSMKSFVKLLVREMESANWDLSSAVQFIVPGIIIAETNHRSFAFESFVSKTMLEGFNQPNFSISAPHDQQSYLGNFRKMKPVNPKQYLTQNPNSSLAKFTRGKYLQLVHAKMECSLFGNLNHRKMVNNGGLPNSSMFLAFAEMAKRVWLLHCLAFSFGEKVEIFQVKRNCRFSEVYMECATEEALLLAGEASDASGVSDIRVGFTVVPGFRIGKTMIQSQVYLVPVTAPAS